MDVVTGHCVLISAVVTSSCTMYDIFLFKNKAYCSQGTQNKLKKLEKKLTKQRKPQITALVIKTGFQ